MLTRHPHDLDARPDLGGGASPQPLRDGRRYVSPDRPDQCDSASTGFLSKQNFYFCSLDFEILLRLLADQGSCS